MSWEEIKSEINRHLSLSQIEMYRRCPKQWEFRYVKGIKSPPTSSLILGISVHASIAHNYKTKYRTKKLANRNEIMDAFSYEYDNADIDGLSYEERLKYKQDKDIGYKLTERHYCDLSPTVMPVTLPEQKFEISLPGVKRKIIGFVDVQGNINGSKKPFVIDNKTGARRYNQWEVDINTQLKIYRVANLVTNGKKLKDKNLRQMTMAGVIDAIIRSKCNIITQRLYTPSTFSIDRLIDTISSIEKAIDAGLFYPCDNAQTCSWCGYAHLCQSSAFKRREALKRRRK